MNKHWSSCYSLWYLLFFRLLSETAKSWTGFTKPHSLSITPNQLLSFNRIRRLLNPSPTRFMRFARFVLLITQLLFFIPAKTQSQDTVLIVKDSTREEVRQTVKKEFERWQDSVQAERIKQNIKKNGKSLDAFLQEMQKEEKARKRQLYIRIGFGAAFLAALIIIFLRRRKE